MTVNLYTGNLFLSNNIFSNGELGIDLADDGVTANDADDPDAGANNLQNFPVLTSAEDGSLTIEGTLNSLPNEEFRLEFFSNTECDPSVFGEGETFLGSTKVITDGNGDKDFMVTFLSVNASGLYITATATQTPENNTSEFSECLLVAVPGTDLSVTKSDNPDPVTVGNDVVYQVIVTNNGPDDATGVTLTDTLPGGVTFVSATTSQGSCNEVGGTVTCALGGVANGSSVIVEITITTTGVGTITNTATVAGNETDADGTNNTAVEQTTVENLPTGFYLYPNPLGEKGGFIRLEVDGARTVTIDIYTIAGVRVRQLVKDLAYTPGDADPEWDIRDDNGQKVSNGLYLIQIQLKDNSGNIEIQLITAMVIR